MAEVEHPLPHAVALTWGVAERPQRGPKRELSIERIVEAAITIADAEGLSAVSMSKVATSLGFTTMSLYRYVTSKDDLLLLMQDEACGVAIPPEPEALPWRDGLHAWVRSSAGIFRDHPWYGDLPISGPPMTPNNLLFIDWGLRIIQDLPLTAQEKMSSLLLLSGHARSFGMIERDLSQAQLAGADPDTISGRAYGNALKELVTEERFPNLYPIVQSGVYTEEDAASAETDDFAFGTDRILDGVQAYLDSRSGSATTADAPAPPRAAPDHDDYPRDKGVKEAAKARREAEVKLREALKKEKEAVSRARERAKNAAEAEARKAAKAKP